MNSFFDSLNLRPQERRIIVVVGVIVFVTLNVMLVWPHFGDWNRLMIQINRARADIVRYNQEIAKDEDPKNGFRKKLAKLQMQGGNKVLMSEQNQLQNTISEQAAKAGVVVNVYAPIPTLHTGPTNEFFEEQSVRITTESDEAQLVNFLFNVGTDSSMIRVRELDLKPLDQNRYRLRGNIILTANYQKKPATPPPAPPAAAKPLVRPPTPQVQPQNPAQNRPGPNNQPGQKQPQPMPKPQSQAKPPPPFARPSSQKQ
jgi:hypothetical protein